MTALETVYPRNPTLRAIADARRREVLDLLLVRGSQAPVSDIIAHLVATGLNGSGVAPSTDDRRDVTATLVHQHLPALEDAGLVDWNRDERTVATTTHPALTDPRFRRLLTTETEGLDAALSAVSHDYRRIVLTLLGAAKASVTRTDLAREIVRHETALTEGHPPEVDEVVVSLHHHHLPTLADADFIEFDPDTGRAENAGHPTLEEVFGVIHEPDECIATQLDSVFDELHASYERASREVGRPLAWPHFWRDPSCG